MLKERVVAYSKARCLSLLAEIQDFRDKTVRKVGIRNDIQSYFLNMTQEWNPLHSRLVLITLWTDLARAVPFGSPNN